jgi:prepilin-type N-terminal cleavage/methylation domain-containing protein
MICFRNKQSGFTLIELAVVLVIVGLLIGSLIGSITSRIETTRRDNTIKKLEEVKLAIFGYAAAEGRLPCPATAISGGEEQPVGGGACVTLYGFVPGRTLGLSGVYNRDNLLIDSWGNPFRYSVTGSDANAFTTVPGGGGSIQEVAAAAVGIGLAVLSPDIVICDGDSTAAGSCVGGPNTIIDTAVFNVLSLGKDGSAFITNLVPDSDQGENASEVAVVANATGENLAYTVGNNRVFVSKSYSDAASVAGQFDDLIIWGSQYALYSYMMEAGQLP